MTTDILPGDPLFRLMERIECQTCLDTNIAITLYGPELCSTCAGLRKQWSNAAVQLQHVIYTRTLKKQTVDTPLLALARALTHFTATEPLALKHITEYYRLTERAAKEQIATLRNDWVLPIGSHRQQPYGAYWINSPEEFLEWSRAYRSQAITSLATLYRLQRQHFPRLFGQGEMDFVSLIDEELRGAL